MVDFLVFVRGLVQEAGTDRVDGGSGRAPNPDNTRAAFRRHIPFLLETLLCASVNSFITYLADLLRAILTEYPSKHPEYKQDCVEKAGEAEPARGLRERARNAAAKEATRVAVSGTRCVHDYYKRNLGFELVPDDSAQRRVKLLVDLRNAFIHRRGAPTQKAAEQLRGRIHPDTGEIVLKVHSVFEDAIFLASLVDDIDRRAMRKWPKVEHQEVVRQALRSMQTLWDAALEGRP